MQSYSYSLNLLFEQLGLEYSDEAIENFIDRHKPIGKGLLHEKDFWNKAQSTFLKEAVDADADWVIVVDQLDTMLR